MTTKLKIKNEILSNCLTILNYAIDKKESARVSCENNGFGKNYLSDVKITLEAKVNSGRFTLDEAKRFARLYKRYQDMMAKR